MLIFAFQLSTLFANQMINARVVPNTDWQRQVMCIDEKIYSTTQYSLAPLKEIEEPRWPLGQVLNLLNLQLVSVEWE